MVAAEGHGELGAGGGAEHGDVSREDGRNGRVQPLHLTQEAAGYLRFDVGLELGHGLAPMLVPGEKIAPSWPGQGNDLQGAGARLEQVRLQLLGHGDEGHGQRGEDLKGGGAAPRVGEVMVAHQQEDGDALGCERGDAASELPLVGLGGIAALVGIAAEEDEVDLLPDGEVDKLVEGCEEVEQSCREAKVESTVHARSEGVGQRFQVRLGGGSSVVLHANVDVREVQYAHGPPGPRGAQPILQFKHPPQPARQSLTVSPGEGAQHLHDVGGPQGDDAGPHGRRAKQARFLPVEHGVVADAWHGAASGGDGCDHHLARAAVVVVAADDDCRAALGRHDCVEGVGNQDYLAVVAD